MQTPKTRNGSSSSEVPHKVSPRAARQLRPNALDTDSASPLSQGSKMAKERSPKVADRRSPRSPVPERKRPSRISELESQVSQLQEDLKVVRDQLILSESSKKLAQKEAEESKEQVLALSSKLEDSQKQLLELSAATGEDPVIDLHKTTEEFDLALQSELEAFQNHVLGDSAALAVAMNEIQRLKSKLEIVGNSESVLNQNAESADAEIQNLKQNLSETLSLMENLKDQLRNYKESEAQAKALVNETLLQLEAANRNAEQLRADATKAVDGYNSIALELDNSRAKVNSLEALVSKLEVDDSRFEPEHEGLKQGEDPTLKAEIYNLRAEVGRLRSAVESAETRYQEEQIRSTVQIRNAYELMEQIKSESSRRVCDLEVELKRKKADIEELKANLMDKETELQGIVEENENLSLKLDESMSSQKEHRLKQELKKLHECVVELKADLMDKETTLQNISEVNETLKLEIKRSFSDDGKAREEVTAEVEAAKAAEREALTKLGIVIEEADRSNRKAVRVAEQLDAAQAANTEMEAELRRLKVQSDQWRKAAEAAATMLSAGNNGNKITERTVSLDNNYKCSPFSEHMDDDDFQRKKNGNMLKKIGVLWKKPQK